jgi:hypothetical protein
VLNSFKIFFTVKKCIIILILYSITIMVYFMYFYKPLELLPADLDEFAHVNEILKSINHDDLMFFFIGSFLGVIIILIIITIIYEQIVLLTKPIIDVNARLKSKESAMQLSGSHMGSSYIGYNYSLTFETDNGVEMTLAVIPKYYWTIIEGNRGILKYKQGRVNRFICFDLTSID